MNSASTHQAIHKALTGNRHAATRAPVAAPIEKLLLTANEGAILLGMSVRSFHQKRASLPPCIVLGPRHVRWRKADLVAWVADQNPTPTVRHEPPQLVAGKLKQRVGGGSGGGSAGDQSPAVAQSEHSCGGGRNGAPSNRVTAEFEPSAGVPG